MGLFGIKTKKEKEREEAERLGKEKEELLYRQKELGDSLYSRLSSAVDSNKVSNLHRDGKPGEKVERITLTKIEKSAGRYYIFVGMDDPTCWTMWAPGRRGYDVLQADLDLSKKGKELHEFMGSYGPEGRHALRDFERFSRELCDKVRNFRLYTE